MPFDWMKITSMDKLCSILDSDFMDFTQFDKYRVKEQNLVFDYEQHLSSSTHAPDSAIVKSCCKLVHSVYKFELPHEYKHDVIDIVSFEAKYARRIARFRQIVRDPQIEKVFVRLDNEKADSELLARSLAKYGCENFKIKLIDMNAYHFTGAFDWHRDYIDWSSLVSE